MLVGGEEADVKERKSVEVVMTHAERRGSSERREEGGKKTTAIKALHQNKCVKCDK